MRKIIINLARACSRTVKGLARSRDMKFGLILVEPVTSPLVTPTVISSTEDSQILGSFANISISFGSKYN